MKTVFLFNQARLFLGLVNLNKSLIIFLKQIYNLPLSQYINYNQAKSINVWIKIKFDQDGENNLFFVNITQAIDWSW